MGLNLAKLSLFRPNGFRVDGTDEIVPFDRKNIPAWKRCFGGLRVGNGRVNLDGLFAAGLRPGVKVGVLEGVNKKFVSSNPESEDGVGNAVEICSVIAGDLVVTAVKDFTGEDVTAGVGGVVGTPNFNGGEMPVRSFGNTFGEKSTK